jgi:hypothetical protein
LPGPKSEAIFGPVRQVKAMIAPCAVNALRRSKPGSFPFA